MSRPAVPRSAASLVLLRGDPADPDVVMGRRSDAARFMPGRFVFPGGVREDGDPSLAWTALRETWEETGLIVPAASPGHEAGAGPMQDAYARAGTAPGADRLRPIARAVTPEASPLRFDTVFFLLAGGALSGMPADRGELQHVGWYRASVARATLLLADITAAVLGEAVRTMQEGAMPDRIRRFTYRDGTMLSAWEGWREG